jgi:hypothetical protein
LRNGNFWNGVTASVVNRTAHQMLTADMTLRFFDTENTLIGQSRVTFQVATPLASTDNAAYNSSFGVSISEPNAAVTKIECRPADATFTGGKKWAYGQTWPEKLLPIPKASADTGGGEASSSTPVANVPVASVPVGAAPRFQVAVTNSWNDTLQGYLFVHDTIAVTAANADVTLHGSDLLLTMLLPGGAKKQYIGLSQPAPMYSKLNPLGSQPTAAYEVQPGQDLGRLGAITVPAHTTITTTVTFAVPDQVAIATDNRGVSAR